MVIKSLIFYALTVIVSVAAFFAILLGMKKRKKQLRPLHMFLGFIGFLVMLALMFLVIIFAFSKSSVLYMTAFLPEGIYKVAVAILFFMLLGIIRHFVLSAIYFDRDKTDEGESFLLGFGFSGGAIVAIYSLFMFFTVLSTAITDKFTQFKDGTMLFENGSIIAIFTPLYAHILIAVLFAFYSVLCIAISEFMTRLSSYRYKITKTLTVYSIISVCEIITLCSVLFALNALSVLICLIVSVASAVVSVLTVVYLYKYKEESPYKNQFN